MQNKAKTIVIIGASRGIGKELVLQFAKDKQNTVIALGRSESILTDFKTNNNVFAYRFDLNYKNKPEQIYHNLTEILKSFPKIDILINNAGKLVNKPFLELQYQDLVDSFQVNIIGVIQTVQTIVPKMLENGGHIVNISSMGAFQGTLKFSGLCAYSSSKASLLNFTELFAEEYKDSKIKMNCLCLGAVQTEMLEEAFPGYKAKISAKEMANYILDFSLNAHFYMNGKIIPVSLSTP